MYIRVHLLSLRALQLVQYYEIVFSAIWHIFYLATT